MNSFKEANYEPIKIFGIDGIYTKNRIDDKLPDGFFTYSLMFNNEQRVLSKDITEGCEAIIITKNRVLLKKSKPVEPTDLLFQDSEFNFEKFFNGLHRPFKYQIKAAEDKKNEQLQSKSKSKTKSITPELD